MKLVLNRDYVMVTNSGRSYEFKKGVPTHVPAMFAQAAINIGAEAVSEDKDEANQLMLDADLEEKARLQREPKLREILVSMIERNESGDFTAGGKPNTGKVQKRFGEPVDRAEVEALFAQVQAERAKARQ
jgi:hypothetical protein